MIDNKFFEKAEFLDRNDPLKNFAKEFESDPNVIYFDGNSLGKPNISTIETLKGVIVTEWKQGLIRSWEDTWLDLPTKSAHAIATLLRVDKEEIWVCDNTSTNLYKLAFGALKLQKGRNVVISDSNNFPTDSYILDGLVSHSFPNHTLTKIDASNFETIVSSFKDNVALVCLSHVQYKSGQVYDMLKINQLANKLGILVLWDLSHSAGALDLELKALGCKMAVGCTYKFMNAGPGSSAFLYVDKDLISSLENPIAGWFSHERPFDFSGEFIAANSIRKFSTGTSNILSLAGVVPGVNLLLLADIKSIRTKNVALTEFFIEIFDACLSKLGFILESPRDSSLRGSHVSISHHDAVKVMKELNEPRDGQIIFLPDFRPPNFIRIGVTSLNNSFQDIYQLCKRLSEIVGQ